ncbi:MAG TPA: SAM-dependent methyltransferase [Rhodocyclaceae bacterium]|nr:MAG: SAM-dependent methyltransferase [Rhodocyclales bacterium CG_4_9_14_3_um_filter_68_10]HCX33740.1 SAM-dependent methyltransferase [Rhodocyclaceae bacterium]
MSIAGLSEWLASPQGEYVAAWEQARHDQLVADIFGFNALQIGMLECDLLRANRMPLRFACGREGGEVRSDWYRLPFAATSIDLVVLPHALEFAEHPHQILREIERVLVPEGQVIITGFNPFSLWGIRRFLTRGPAPFPWRGRYLSVMRLKDWLALLGFEMQLGSFGCYAPALKRPLRGRGWRWVEQAGERWWPIAGAIYVVQAVKRVHGMRLIQPAWRDRKARAKALAPVVQRSPEPLSVQPHPAPGGARARRAAGDR